jgi:antitoxin component YwqK of YwqJK toxin-antitoxin module
LALLVFTINCHHGAESSPDKSVSAGTSNPGVTGEKAEDAVQETPNSTPSRQREAVEEKWVDGTPKSREEFILDPNGNQILDGVSTYWWESGKKKLEMHYRNGLAHGRKTTWFSDGELWSEGSFVADKEHGVWTVWFPGGKRQHEFHMDHGAMHGVERRWHDNGELLMQGLWVRGKQTGFFSYWNLQGKLVRETEFPGS